MFITDHKKIALLVIAIGFFMASVATSQVFNVVVKKHECVKVGPHHPKRSPPCIAGPPGCQNGVGHCPNPQGGVPVQIVGFLSNHIENQYDQCVPNPDTDCGVLPSVQLCRTVDVWAGRDHQGNCFQHKCNEQHFAPQCQTINGGGGGVGIP